MGNLERVKSLVEQGVDVDSGPAAGPAPGSSRRGCVGPGAQYYAHQCAQLYSERRSGCGEYPVAANG